MRICQSNGIDLHWREDGDRDGIPVVFSNSLGTDMRLWDPILPSLPDGFRFIRYDTRGHGLSACPDGAYRLQDLAEDAAGLMDHLDLRGAIFVGLSIGGMTGQLLAANRPDLVRALVLSNTAAKMGDRALWQPRIDAARAGGLEALADAIVERWFGPAFRNTDEVVLWRRMVTRTPLAGYLGCAEALADTDLSASTRNLRLPVLGLAGDEDGSSPPDMVKATTDLIPGSQFHVFKGAGHLPCVDAATDYAAVLSRFLGSQR